MADATTHRRDEILVAFHRDCPRPTSDDIGAWVERHPDLADDVRIHAEALLAGIQDRHLRPEPSAGLIERTRSTSLGALDAARARAAVAAEPVPRFADLMAAAETDIPRLARTVDIGRAPLVDLVQGRVDLPLPAAFLAVLADALRTTVAAIDAAASGAGASPAMGYAKAEGTPTARRRAFVDIVRDDPTMSSEAKARWLSLAGEG